MRFACADRVWVISETPRRDGDRSLQLLVFNEEFLVGAGHQPAPITSLPFVHTARRSYRLNGPARPPEDPVPHGVGPVRPARSWSNLTV